MEDNITAPSWLTVRHLDSMKTSRGAMGSIAINPLNPSCPVGKGYEMAQFVSLSNDRGEDDSAATESCRKVVKCLGNAQDTSRGVKRG